jgi:hypothetical protein
VSDPSRVEAHFQTEVYKDPSESQRRSTSALGRGAAQRADSPKKKPENAGICGSPTARIGLQGLYQWRRSVIWGNCDSVTTFCNAVT